MKTKVCSFFVLFAIAAVMVSSTPAAFADRSEVTISTADTDLVTPSACFESEAGCYTPSTVTVDVGDVVTMTNADETAIHTYTSGTVEGYVPSPDDKFDSSFLYPGESWILDKELEPGTYPYYCTSHVWMKATLIVQEAKAAEEETMEETPEEETMEETPEEETMEETPEEETMEETPEEETMEETPEEETMEETPEEETMEETPEEETMEETPEEETMEEELVVTITDSVVDGGTQVNLDFSTIHVNYEITAMQNGEEIFKEAAHAMEMTGASHMIDAVGSDESPIDIEIVSLGIGPPGADQDWTGPTGTVASTQVVPEFGTIAMMILVVAIISIVAVTAKSRIVPRF